MNNIINGKLLQEELKTGLKELINNISDKLKLVVIQVGNDSASDLYVRSKESLCKEMGILFEYKRFDNILEDELIFEIEKLNNDSSVTGIFIELPLPSNFNQDNVIRAISPYKDVDGLTSCNEKRGIFPCTSLAVMKILEKYESNIFGKNVVIVGRSKLVGMPLIKLLLDKDATVISCNSKTSNLRKLTSLADILIVAIGEKNFIDDTYIKDGVTVIDVGTNTFNGRIYGDCNFEKIVNKCKYITPPVGGVGPMTNIMVIDNIVRLYNFKKNN